MRKWLTCLTILLVGLVFVLGLIIYALEVYVPRMAEESIASFIQTKLRLEKLPEVKLKYNTIELLGGKLSEVDIFLPELVYENMSAEKVRVEISQIHLNIAKLVQEQRLELSEPFDVWASFYWSEQELKSQLEDLYSEVISDDLKVKLESGKVVIDTDVEPVKGLTIPVTLVGRLEANGSSIRFMPVDVLGVDPLVASVIKTVIFPDLKKNIFLQNLPSGVKILKVKILPDKLLVEAEMKDVVLPSEMMNR